MTLTALSELRGWLTLDEAALPLSPMMGKTLIEADVLSLGLGGHLKLAVNLPPETVTQWRAYVTPQHPTPPRYIEGVWDLPIVPPGSLQLASRYAELRRLPTIRMDGTIGALVVRPGVRGRLRAEEASLSSPASAFPVGSEIVIRIAAITEFLSAVANPSQAASLDKPLGERERATLLIIIAALAKQAEIPVSKPSKAGEIIAALTEALDVNVRGVSARTVEDHLKRIPDALDRHRTISEIS